MVTIYIGANVVLQGTIQPPSLNYTTLLHSLYKDVLHSIQHRLLNFEF